MQFPIFSNFADELFEQSKTRRFRSRRTEFFGGVAMPLARSKADTMDIVAGMEPRRRRRAESPGHHPLYWRGARCLSGAAKPDWSSRRQSLL